MCLRHTDTDQDLSIPRLDPNNFTEKIVRLEEEGYLSAFLLKQFLSYTYGRINNEGKSY